MPTKRYLVAITATAALALSACGGSDSAEDSSDAQASETSSQSSESSSEESTTDATPSEETSEEDPSDTESEEESSESEDDDAATGKDELTEPGTELGLEETATIPQGDDGAALTVTVTKIEKGKSADLSKLENADEYKEYTPVYVHYEMTGTNSSGDLEDDILEDVDPILTTGQKAPTLSIVGTSPFEKCDRNAVPEDFGPGDTEETCDVAMIKDGMEIGGAQFRAYDTKYEDEGMIVWKK